MLAARPSAANSLRTSGFPGSLVCTMSRYSQDGWAGDAMIAAARVGPCGGLLAAATRVNLRNLQPALLYGALAVGAVWKDLCVGSSCLAGPPNGLEVSRPAGSRIPLDEPRPQLAGSAPPSC